MTQDPDQHDDRLAQDAAAAGEALSDDSDVAGYGQRTETGAPEDPSAAPAPGTGPEAGTEPGDEAGYGRRSEAGDEAEAGSSVDGTTPEPGGSTAESDQLAVTTMALEERTLDLQRLQAEFVNYKRRVERDRDLVRQNATFDALAPIVEVLDTIDRAREHGELEPGLKTVADQLERTVTASGLEKFGAAGDAFDPNVHDALSHLGEDPDVEVTTCKVVAKAGYRIGERVVRAAQVLVVDPPAATQD